MNAPTSPLHLMPEVNQRAMPPALLEALKARFGANLSTALVVREQHGRDESSYSVPPPSAVVFAESTQDVADAVRLSGEHNMPVIPFAVGSSLEGHLLAVQGGISIDLNRMNKVLSINADDLTVTVQPGVTRKQLNEEVKSTGLFFPIDPGADASIGGMSATSPAAPTPYVTAPCAKTCSGLKSSRQTAASSAPARAQRKAVPVTTSPA